MKFLREPLFHFFLIGAAIFLLHGLLGKSFDKPRGNIVISGRQIETLAEGWRRTWQRAPTAAELEGLIQDAIQEEILYREALALGLDRDDSIVRRRLRQKMEFLSEEVSAQAQPSDQQLKDFLSARPDSFQGEIRLSFSHIYLDPGRPGRSQREAESLLKKLNGDSRGIDAATLSDPIALPFAYTDLSASEMEKQFGPSFADRLIKIEPGSWQGPVTSGFGQHLVKVSERKDGKAQEFSEIKDALKREWLAAQRSEFKTKLIQRLSENYSIQVERPEWAKVP